MNRLVFASTISKIEQSDVFMTVAARICEAPKANLNGARVTEAFIKDIVSNKNKYVGLPLNADVKALLSGSYRRLGHLYDAKTGEFKSTQIGSFYDFEKEDFDGGCYLVGYARIPKRNKKLSRAISELFADGALKFSFEVTVGEYEELDDGTFVIDASDSNYLEGTAIVSFPACEEAVALELVAQQTNDQKGDEKEMVDVVNENVVAEEEKVETSEEKIEPTEVAAETQPEPETAIAEEEKPAEEETIEDDIKEASCKKKNGETENAAVLVHQEHTEVDTVNAYDTETGVEVSQTTTVHTELCKTEEGQIVNVQDEVAQVETPTETAEIETAVETPVETAETAENVEPVQETKIAEADGDSETPSETPTGNTPVTDTPTGNTPVTDTPAAPVVTAPASGQDDIAPDSEPAKKTAEQMFAELAETIESLKKEIAELKGQKVISEQKTVAAEINPFIDSIQTAPKYTLLEKDEKPVNHYSLLEKY